MNDDSPSNAIASIPLNRRQIVTGTTGLAAGLWLGRAAPSAAAQDAPNPAAR
jgi:hypothetical protein